MDTQTYLDPEGLQAILKLDVYYSLPVSISSWVCSLKLKSSEQICLERIISHNIMSHGKASRLSLTYLEKITNLSKRTVGLAITSLISKNHIDKKETNDLGSLLLAKIPVETRNNIKVRFKGKASTNKANPTPTKTTPVEADIQIDNSKVQDELNVKQAELDALLHELNALGHLSPKERMLKVSSLDIDIEDIERLEKDIKALDNLLSKELSKPSKAISGEKVLLVKPVNKIITSTPLRAVRVSQIKEIMARLKKCTVTLTKEMLLQITWNIRFGWYRTRQEWTNKHCINHALKMVKNNSWTTPSGFQAKQIVGLVEYALAKGG